MGILRLQPTARQRERERTRQASTALHCTPSSIRRASASLFFFFMPGSSSCFFMLWRDKVSFVSFFFVLLSTAADVVQPLCANAVPAIVDGFAHAHLLKGQRHRSLGNDERLLHRKFSLCGQNLCSSAALHTRTRPSTGDAEVVLPVSSPSSFRFLSSTSAFPILVLSEYSRRRSS